MWLVREPTMTNRTGRRRTFALRLVVPIVLLASASVTACMPRTTIVETPTTEPVATAAETEVPTPTPVVTATPDAATGCVEGEPRVIVTSALHYEGTCYGWRVGSEEGGEPYDRSLRLDCDPELYGDSIEISGPPWDTQRSDLDIDITDVPDGYALVHIDKWTCGERGVSDHAVITFEGDFISAIDVARYLEGTAWLVIDAAPGHVEPCTIEGLPAVCVEPVISESGFGQTPAAVFVLEDASLDPHGTVLRLWSDAAGLDELRELASLIEAARG